MSLKFRTVTCLPSVFQTLLHTCNNLVNHDLHLQLASLTVAASRGIAPRVDTCNLCNKLYMGTRESNGAICFRYGQPYGQ